MDDSYLLWQQEDKGGILRVDLRGRRICHGGASHDCLEGSPAIPPSLGAPLKQKCVGMSSRDVGKRGRSFAVEVRNCYNFISHDGTERCFYCRKWKKM